MLGANPWHQVLLYHHILVTADQENGQKKSGYLDQKGTNSRQAYIAVDRGEDTSCLVPPHNKILRSRLSTTSLGRIYLSSRCDFCHCRRSDYFVISLDFAKSEKPG